MAALPSAGAARARATRNHVETIVAIATPPGRGGLGVVRLSGDTAFEVAAQFVTGKRVGHLLDAEKNIVDQVVISRFHAPRSYTGENVVEISCHGSPVILRFCVERACACGARLAEPGEFTLRAFVNGRIDLPQAEAVRDLIDATTLYQARVAARQVEGSVAKLLAPWKSQLLELIAVLEAGIDFAEDDISVAPAAELRRRIEPLLHGIEKLAASFAYGRLVHNGVTLAIVGRPNVGKSSLFNRLLEQDRAIVTAIPGTTRDLVSETAALEGVPVRFVDTAGIREGSDLVESLGIERSLRAMADADLTLVVIDGSAERTPEDESILQQAQGRRLIIANKSDLPNFHAPRDAIAVSAVSGEGIQTLKNAILDAIGRAAASEDEFGFITSLRQSQLLAECAGALRAARVAVDENIPHEMLLLDLYGALHPLDAITGKTTADDILNRIFSTFCIGK